MARNLILQPLRGVQSNLQAAMPLSLGEMYFATDTGFLYFGTPGVGIGYIQIGDTNAVNETMQACLNELKSIRLALIYLACEGNKNKPGDFNPESLSSDPEIGKQA